MTDPTAIRLAIEERRADFAVALADLHNQAARRAVQTTEAEIEYAIVIKRLDAALKETP